MGVTVDRFELEQRVDGGSWSPISTALSNPSISRTLAVTHTYEYRVRAIDTSEHVGPWIAAAPFRATLTENTSGALWYRGTWASTSRSTAFSGGSARTTTARDGRVTLTFTGSGVSWLAALGPTRGRVTIYLDGVLVKTQDLRAAANDTRRLVFVKRWATVGRHTITISRSGDLRAPTLRSRHHPQLVGPLTTQPCGRPSVPPSRRKRSISPIRSSPDGSRCSSTIDSSRST